MRLRDLVLSPVCVCVFALTGTSACKSERADSEAGRPSATAAPSPIRPLPPDPPPLDPKLAALVDDVATDPLVHEDFRLLLDGLSTDTLLPLMKHRIKAAPAEALACAHARTRAALAEAKADTKHPSQLRIATALENVLGALTAELTARKMDPLATLATACVAAERHDP